MLIPNPTIRLLSTPILIHASLLGKKRVYIKTGYALNDSHTALVVKYLKSTLMFQHVKACKSTTCLYEWAAVFFLLLWVPFITDLTSVPSYRRKGASPSWLLVVKTSGPSVRPASLAVPITAAGISQA